MKAKTEAQKEAKRLYGLFRNSRKDSPIGSTIFKVFAKEAAIIAAKEMEKAELKGKRLQEDIKQFYKDVRKSIREL